MFSQCKKCGKSLMVTNESCVFDMCNSCRGSSTQYTYRGISNVKPDKNTGIEEVEVIRDRYQTTTPGDWKVIYERDCPDSYYPVAISGPENVVGQPSNVITSIEEMTESDAEFIARAHQDIPILLNAIDRLCGLLVDTQDVLRDARKFIERGE